MAGKPCAPRKLTRDDVWEGFDCGAPELDEWLVRYAWQNQRANNAVTYVSVLDERVVGYYAIAVASDEFVQFSEPSRGVYQTVIIRGGILIGATLLGDVRKVASLTHAFDRQVPLPQERIKLLFDIGVPSLEVGAVELADDAQVCNCNGVSKGALVACVRDGQRTVSGVMAATRAGRGVRLLQGPGGRHRDRGAGR